MKPRALPNIEDTIEYIANIRNKYENNHGPFQKQFIQLLLKLEQTDIPDEEKQALYVAICLLPLSTTDTTGLFKNTFTCADDKQAFVCLRRLNEFIKKNKLENLDDIEIRLANVSYEQLEKVIDTFSFDRRIKNILKAYQVKKQGKPNPQRIFLAQLMWVLVDVANTKYKDSQSSDRADLAKLAMLIYCIEVINKETRWHSDMLTCCYEVLQDLSQIDKEMQISSLSVLLTFLKQEEVIIDLFKQLKTQFAEDPVIRKMSSLDDEIRVIRKNLKQSISDLKAVMGERAKKMIETTALVAGVAFTYATLPIAATAAFVGGSIIGHTNEIRPTKNIICHQLAKIGDDIMGPPCGTLSGVVADQLVNTFLGFLFAQVAATATALAGYGMFKFTQKTMTYSYNAVCEVYNYICSTKSKLSEAEQYAIDQKQGLFTTYFFEYINTLSSDARQTLLSKAGSIGLTSQQAELILSTSPFLSDGDDDDFEIVHVHEQDEPNEPVLPRLRF